MNKQSHKFNQLLDEPVGAIETSWAGRLINQYLRWGITGFPRIERRRLAIVNLTGLLVAISCLGYAICFALFDFNHLSWAVGANLIFGILFLLTPHWHRFGLIAAATYLLALSYVALFWFSLQLGIESGTHLNFLTAIAIATIIFGNRRIWLSMSIAAGLTLHLFAHHYHRTSVIDPVLFDWLFNTLYFNAVATFVVVVSLVVWYAFRIAAEAEERAETLLKNVLPEQIALRLKNNPTQPIADRFAEASVLFADLVDFTPISGKLDPEKLVGLLNEVFCRFDGLCELHRAEKIKTIGDAYMAVSGAPQPNDAHASDLIRLARAMLRALAEIERHHQIGLRIRIGIATGPITAGVIGRAKFSYDVWAPTVNLAARLQANGEVGRIHVSEETRRASESDFEFEPADKKILKGIGQLRTWFVTD